ncbi:hypothetical protein EDD22DRAFT_876339 [Suillus occidentalis]|nr:hypothetical protein EDD22DRAFT_876339 [Suillus occidentalis]
MHPALFLSEVLRQIFPHLYQIPGVNSGLSHEMCMSEALFVLRKSLAALARTCKTFHEPAMELLWGDLDGITPLLGCVPTLYPIIGGKHWKDFSCLPVGIKPLSKHETLHFMRHAARVRVLRMTASHLYFLRVLEASETSLFPKLWSLSLSEMPDARHVQFLLSPALRRLSIQTLSSDIPSIVARCAALEDLIIKRPYHNTAYELSLPSDIVRSCKRLVNLSCNTPLNWAAWKHLSDTPTLRTVDIEGGVLSPFNYRLKFAPFIELTALSLSSDTTTDITAVLQHSEFPSLQSFNMRVRGCTRAEAEQFFRALSQCKASRTLKHIEIDSLRFCPHLHTLQVMIDTSMGIDIGPAAESFQHTTLRKLRVGASSAAATEVEAVARIIFSVLPCADLVTEWGWGSRGSLWHEVNRRIQALRSSPALSRVTGAAAPMT